MNPTSKVFKQTLDDVIMKADNKDKSALRNIKIEMETKEATATGGGTFEPPAFSLFSNEAPKKTKPKGGEVKEMERLKGGKSDRKTFQDLVDKYKKDEKQLKDIENQLKLQLNKGIKIEMEHTNDKKVAQEIAMDHLFENPNYYTKLEKIEKGEFKEATGSASSGSFVGASFLAKSQSKKDWRGAAKPLYKGGKFVRVKKKCKTFPYCNQGDIKALELWEDDKLTEAIKNVAKNKNIHENVVRAIVLHEIEEKLFGE